MKKGDPLFLIFGIALVLLASVSASSAQTAETAAPKTVGCTRFELVLPSGDPTGHPIDVIVHNLCSEAGKAPSDTKNRPNSTEASGKSPGTNSGSASGMPLVSKSDQASSSVETTKADPKCYKLEFKWHWDHSGTSWYDVKVTNTCHVAMTFYVQSTPGKEAERPFKLKPGETKEQRAPSASGNFVVVRARKNQD